VNVLLKGVGNAFGQRLQEQLIDPLRQCLVMRFVATRQRECRITLGAQGALCEQPDTQQHIALCSPETDRDRFADWFARVFGQQKPLLRVCLEADLVLIRQVRLPLAAGKNLPQVLSYEMDRLSPFESDQVYFHFTPETQRNNPSEWLQGELILARKAHLDPWYHLFNKVGAVIDRVTLQGASQPLNLKPRTAAKSGVSHWLNQSLWIGLIILFALYLGGGLWQERQIAHDLEVAMHAARGAAGRARQLQDRVNQSRDAISRVTRQRQAYLPLSDVLLELTRLTPEGSWFRHVSLVGDQVSLAGESDQASDLIGILERSPLFEAVRFKSSVVRSRQSGKENFNIILTLSRESTS
jgi:general secretion pathway protein L